MGTFLVLTLRPHLPATYSNVMFPQTSAEEGGGVGGFAILCFMYKQRTVHFISHFVCLSAPIIPAEMNNESPWHRTQTVICIDKKLLFFRFACCGKCVGNIKHLIGSFLLETRKSTLHSRHEKAKRSLYETALSVLEQTAKLFRGVHKLCPSFVT